jgi:hypothetical protein
MTTDERENIARYFDRVSKTEGITAKYWWQEAAKRIRALPQAQAVPGREDAARIIDPAAFAPHGITGDEDWHPNDQRLQQESALRKADAILALPQAQADRWLPISTAPKDGTLVDLWCRAPGLSAEPGRVPDCWHSNGRWWRYDEQYGGDQCRSAVHYITHWRHLPAPPVIAEQQEVKS